MGEISSFKSGLSIQQLKDLHESELTSSRDSRNLKVLHERELFQKENYGVVFKRIPR